VLQLYSHNKDSMVKMNKYEKEKSNGTD